jgi:hypothetical protein
MNYVRVVVKKNIKTVVSNKIRKILQFLSCISIHKLILSFKTLIKYYIFIYAI